jgi:hypothetical protein
MDINYDLTVSGDSTINQSVATTASPTFASATITDKKNSLARVYLGTNQTGLVDATATKILFDTETFDVGGNFASYKYTCPVAGYYLVTWRVNLQSPGGILLVGAHTSLYKNGAVAGSGSGPGFGTNTCSRFRSVGSTIVYCAASDYLEIYATIDTSDSSTGTVDAGETNSYAMFYLLSTG